MVLVLRERLIETLGFTSEDMEVLEDKKLLHRIGRSKQIYYRIDEVNHARALLAKVHHDHVSLEEALAQVRRAS